MILTNVFSRNVKAYNAGIRRIVNKGGTSSTKTYSLLQLALLIANRHRKEGKLISVMSETLPHLKLGAIRDFEKILRQEDMYNERFINFTDHTYHFGNSQIEFFSADAEKATGPRRDILFLNECNNMQYKVVREATLRTNDTVFYDFNPTFEFWMEEKVLSLPDTEVILIKSNYKDGMEVLPPSIVREIELNAKLDPNFKRIHVDVEYGVYEGLIFPSWNFCEGIPDKAERRCYGMDFGFTNAATTLMDVALFGDAIYIDQLLYETHMTSGDIIKFLKQAKLNSNEIIADSEDPRTITEIKNAGFNVKPADKGPDSVIHGIDLMKVRKIFITKRSTATIKEFRNYRWKTNTDGKFVNQPMKVNDHAIDGIRYPVSYMLDKKIIKPPSYWVTTQR